MAADEDNRTPKQFRDSVQRYLRWQYERHFEKYGRLHPETRCYAMSLQLLNDPRQFRDEGSDNSRLGALLEAAIRQADELAKKQPGSVKRGKEKRRA